MDEYDEDAERGLDEQKLESLRGNMRAFRDYLEDQAAESVSRVAYSTDGRTFDYEAPLSLPLPVGGYVELRTGAEVKYLGQLTSKSVVEQVGAEVDFELDERHGELAPDGLNVSSVRNNLSVLALEGTGVLLGSVTDDEITPTSNTDTFRNAKLCLADSALVSRYLSGSGRNARLRVGPALYVDGDATVSLDAGGFNRHTFLCGQSGSGKTFSLGVVIEQLLLETDLRIVVIDPNSDFVGLDSPRTRNSANRVRSNSLDADEYERVVERYRDATAGLRVFRPNAVAGVDDDVLRVRFGDLSREEQGSVLQLDPLDDREEFNAFWTVVDRLGHRDYSWDEVRESIAHDYTTEVHRLGLRIENLGLTEWDVWCSPGEPSLIDAMDCDDWRCLVLDVGTLGSSSEKMVITNAVLTHLWRERHDRRPTLVIVDEAHNVCQRDPADELGATSVDAVNRIAAEGRKFGLYLLLSTQRPGKIQENALTQCDNLVLMRMNSASDLDHLSTVFSQVPATLLAEAKKFGLGETILGGRIVQNPTFAKFEGRLSEEGGSDVPSTWAERRE